MSKIQQFILIITSAFFLSPSVFAADNPIEVCHYEDKGGVEVQILALKLSPAITHLDRHDDGLLVAGVCQTRICSNCLLLDKLVNVEMAYMFEQKKRMVGEIIAYYAEYCLTIMPTEPPNGSNTEAWERYEQCLADQESDVEEARSQWDFSISEVEEATNSIRYQCNSQSSETACALNRLADELPCNEVYDAAVAAAGDELASCYSPPKGDVTTVQEMGDRPNLACMSSHANQIRDADAVAVACFQAAADGYNNCLSWPSACP